MPIRPCDKGMFCSFSRFDYAKNCKSCANNFTGDNCPYIKPWGKKKYEREMEKYWKEYDCATINC